MIDLRQLQALSAVAREGSVSRAALRLGWSQPTVDYHLKNLDQIVGTPLLLRSTRGSALTSAGTLMVERAAEILGLAERAVTDTQELANLGRVRVRFGIFPTAAARLLPDIVSRLGLVGVELDASLEEVSPLVTGVNRRELDAALVYTAGGYQLPFRAEVHTTPVLSEPLLLVLPQGHRFAEQEHISHEDLLSLAGDPWVLGATAGDTMDDAVRDVFQAAGLELNVAMRSDDFSVVQGLVAAGMVIGLVPELALITRRDDIVAKPIVGASFTREIVLAAQGEGPGKQPPAAVRQLAEAIRRSVQATRIDRAP